VQKIRGEKKLIVVARRSPADIAVIPDDVQTLVATYGIAETSLHALARTLRGDVVSSGVLPVGSGSGKVLRGSGLDGWKCDMA
jgi:hypothetical protein